MTTPPMETFGFECDGLQYVCTIGRFSDGGIAELFLSNDKAGSAADDSAIATSLAFHHGADKLIRKAFAATPAATQWTAPKVA